VVVCAGGAGTARVRFPGRGHVAVRARYRTLLAAIGVDPRL